MWKKLTKFLVKIYTKEKFSLKLQLSKLKNLDIILCLYQWIKASFFAYINELKSLMTK